MNRPDDAIATVWMAAACCLAKVTAGTHAVAPSGF